MKKLIILIICTIFLVSFVSGQAEVTRELPDTVLPGQDIEVKLNIKLTGDAPNGLIIEEELPAEWEIVEAAGGIEREGRFAFLLYGSNVQDKTITYILKAPEDLTQSASITGAWQTISTGGMVEGDVLFILGEPTGINITLFIIIGALVIIGLVIYLLKKKKE